MALRAPKMREKPKPAYFEYRGFRIESPRPESFQSIPKDELTRAADRALDLVEKELQRLKALGEDLTTRAGTPIRPADVAKNKYGRFLLFDSWRMGRPRGASPLDPKEEFAEELRFIIGLCRTAQQTKVAANGQIQFF